MFLIISSSHEKQLLTKISRWHFITRNAFCGTWYLPHHQVYNWKLQLVVS